MSQSVRKQIVTRRNCRESGNSLPQIFFPTAIFKSHKCRLGFVKIFQGRSTL